MFEKLFNKAPSEISGGSSATVNNKESFDTNETRSNGYDSGVELCGGNAAEQVSGSGAAASALQRVGKDNQILLHSSRTAGTERGRR